MMTADAIRALNRAISPGGREMFFTNNGSVPKTAMEIIILNFAFIVVFQKPF
jgi:hypothetical protein